MTENVNVTINGLTVAVPKGTTIIEAAKQAGVLVPHYCYHPSLPSPAVCRMCLVEVEKAPKLMPACVTTVAEGQVVHVDSERGQEGARGCARAAADQSSARLSHLRSGRRVRAAELRLPGRPSRYSVQRVRQAVQSGRRVRTRRALRRQPVHPLHPLRAVHGRCRGRGGPERFRTGRPGLHRHRSRITSWTIRGPATWWISARSARSSRRTSCTRLGPGIWTRPPASAPGAARAATS